jgi:hypothetical protein
MHNKLKHNKTFHHSESTRNLAEFQLLLTEMINEPTYDIGKTELKTAPDQFSKSALDHY